MKRFEMRVGDWVRVARWAGGVALAALASASVAHAQQARGTVADSASRLPIPGAVVTMLDASGNVVGRTMSNERGAYAVRLPPEARRLRAVRIGFRPREMSVDPGADANPTLNVLMTVLPTLLEPARVNEKDHCPRRSDAAAAFGLWEQVRAGLLTTIVAREQNPGALTLLGFERVYHNITDSIVRMVVRRDSTERSMNSYKAVRTADDFVRYGFNSARDGSFMFFGPDAEVLLDNGFAAGYCFRIVRGDRNRPNQVGLGFTAPDRRDGRIDIDGALWVDTLAREIRDIDFKYVGISGLIDSYEPGGNIAFRSMPNGVAFIDRWYLRLIAGREDTVGMRASARDVAATPIPVLKTSFYYTSAGGELAHARWPDGSKFDATLGHLAISAIKSNGAVASGRTLELLETPYIKELDHTSRWDLPDLLPGPYVVAVHEPRLAPLRLDSIPTRYRIFVERGKTRLSTVIVPSLEEWVLQQCASEGRVSTPGGTLVLARVMDEMGAPLAHVQFVIRALDGSEAPTQAPWRSASGETGSDGIIPICQLQKMIPGTKLTVELRRSGFTDMSLQVRLGPPTEATIMPLVFTGVAKH